MDVLGALPNRGLWSRDKPPAPPWESPAISSETMALKTASICFLILAWTWIPCLRAEPSRLADAPDAHWWGFGNWCWPLDKCTPEDRGLNDDVGALAVFRGDLIVGGAFTAAGSVPLDQIGRWDGEAWHQLSGGIDHLDCPGLACYAWVGALRRILYIGCGKLRSCSWRGSLTRREKR